MLDERLHHTKVTVAIHFTKNTKKPCKKPCKSNTRLFYLLPVFPELSGVSPPLENRMESSCRSGGGLRSGEQQDGVNARIFAAEAE